MVSEDIPDPDDDGQTETSPCYLDAINDECEQSVTAWYIRAMVNNNEVVFKVDTGAEVTAISKEVYDAIGQPRLHKPTKVLCGPSRQPLDVLGRITVQLRYKNNTIKHHMYVVKTLNQNLLGLPAILALNILTKVDAAGDTTSCIPSQFPELFQGLGTMKDEYEIKIKPDAMPYALFSARWIPIPLRHTVEQELKQMEVTGVISKVDQPTNWWAGMVVVKKKSGGVRICVDLKPLNQNVLREVHLMPHVEDTLAQLQGGKVFSKLDANSGFWQVPLAKNCRHLTTFITPFGRYCFNKLPFGISSAPEFFQKQMSHILEGLPGVLCHLDDILVFGSDRTEHDTRLRAVLLRIRTAGITLNRAKCEFGKHEITFLGHIINQSGISADPEKLSAIKEMPPPTNITKLRRFMGVINQLGKFSPNTAELSAPLRTLLSTNQAWFWGPDQDIAFNQLKTELITPHILTMYDPKAQTKISADASSFGLGAVLLQAKGTSWHPVVYASRSMTSTERRYAQIEKEALAITWACEKFSSYIIGNQILLETDHKPLVPLLTYKHIENLPPRVL